MATVIYKWKKKKKIEKKILKNFNYLSVSACICLYLFVSASIRLCPPLFTCRHLPVAGFAWICIDLHRFAQICIGLHSVKHWNANLRKSKQINANPATGWWLQSYTRGKRKKNWKKNSENFNYLSVSAFICLYPSVSVCIHLDPPLFVCRHLPVAGFAWICIDLSRFA